MEGGWFDFTPTGEAETLATRGGHWGIAGNTELWIEKMDESIPPRGKSRHTEGIKEVIVR